MEKNPKNKKKKEVLPDVGKGAIGRARQNYIKRQLEFQDKEKQKREVARNKQKAKRERKKSSRALMKRTKKGQPVMHLQVGQLLKKIESDSSKR